MSRKYDAIFARDPQACGEPFPAIVAALKRLPIPSTVLDLGCGQGRDSLTAAELGHEVLGVDISETGVRQMLAVAEEKALSVRGLVADIGDFTADRRFDLVLLDRVLHMLDSDDSRWRVLHTSIGACNEGGQAVVADVPSHLPLIRRFFDEEAISWTVRSPGKGLLFARAPGLPSA